MAVMVLIVDFNFKMSSKLLTCVGENHIWNFIFQKIEGMIWVSSLLDLVLTNKGELVKNVEVLGNLGINNQD